MFLLELHALLDAFDVNIFSIMLIVRDFNAACRFGADGYDGSIPRSSI